MSDELHQLFTGPGAELRLVRIQAGLTQADISRGAGIPRQLVDDVENSRTAELGAYLAVSKVLGRRVKMLMLPPLSPGEQAVAGQLEIHRPGQSDR